MDPGAWWATVHRVKRVGAVQYSSDAKSCPILCDPMNCSMPGSSVHHYLPEFAKFMSTEWMMLSKHLIFCHPLLLLPSTFPSIRVFSSESALCIKLPKNWSFSFSISLSNEYSGLIFRIDWFDLLAVQGNLKSLFQHHNLKASVLWCSAFFTVQPSLLYGPTLTSLPDYWKNQSYDYTDFCQQNYIFAFNVLSRFVTAFLPRSKCLLISWL